MLPFDRSHRVPKGRRPLARLPARRPGELGHRGQPQGVRGHERRLGEQGRALHHVRQLPDVARPAIGEEGRPRVGGERLRSHAVVSARPREEVLRQEEDVGSSLGERGEPHGHDSQPVIEILTEPASPHRVEEILARRRDDRDVGRLALRAAEPANRAVFEDLQELRLDALRQQAHLVQEERAAVRRLEEARLGLAGIGEGPPLEAEQLRFEERLGDCGAVQLDERSRCPGARPVEGPGKQSLPRPGLALDQDGRQPAPLGPAREQPPDRVADGLDRRALPEQLRQGGHGWRVFYAGVACLGTGRRSRWPIAIRREPSQTRPAPGDRGGEPTAPCRALKLRAPANRSSARSRSCWAQASSMGRWRIGHLRADV